MNGTPVAEFTAQKLRLRPTMIGFPTAIVSLKLPEVVEYGRRMIAALGYNGFSCMEFKRDARDNVYKLMEVNGRHNFSGLLAGRCGVNFPYISYLEALGQSLPIDRYEQPEGVYWLDEHMDIRGLFRALRQGRAALRDYSLPYRRGTIRRPVLVGPVADVLQSDRGAQEARVATAQRPERHMTTTPPRPCEVVLCSACQLVLRSDEWIPGRVSIVATGVGLASGLQGPRARRLGVRRCAGHASRPAA